MAKPFLRFKEFRKVDNEWVSTLINDCVTFSKGGALSKSDLDVNGDMPCILYGDLYTKYGEVTKLVQNKTIKSEGLTISKSGDVLLPMSGETAEDIAKATCLLKDGVAYGGDLLILRSNSFYGPFLSYSLNSANRRKISKIAQGKSVVHINAKEISKLDINVPSYEEQQKIAEFFTVLDENIRICEAKIDSTERLLAGLMDALFKQKIRLKNSEGSYYPDWRKSTIGKEGSFHYGKSAPKWSLSDEATTPCVRYGDLYTKFRYKIDSVNTFTNIDKKDLVFSKGGEVLVPRVGEDPNDFCKCAYLPFEGIAIGEMVSIYESQHDGMFLSFYFNSQMRKEFAKYVEGGNVSNLYYTYLEDIEITIPSLEEQKAISEFLTDVVNKLDFLKQSKQKYITLKKAFMQRMFV